MRVKNRLFIVGRFTHDPHGILAAVGQFALMGIERGFELRIIALAKANHRRGLSYDSQLALWHDLSLPQGRYAGNAWNFKWHHYTGFPPKLPDSEILSKGLSGR